MQAKASGVTKVLVQDQIPTDEMMAGGHLSVRRVADVALDTPGYNGHTTVSFTTTISLIQLRGLFSDHTACQNTGGRIVVGWSTDGHITCVGHDGCTPCD